jgi:uncharacterized membrane protein
MSDQSVIGIYKSMDDAEKAIRALDAAKFPIRQASIVTKDIASEKKVHGYVTACDVSKQGAATGAWVGGIFGLLIGAAFMFVPGVGPVIVAGSLASALLGGVEGAVAGAALGGILSGLAAWGVSKQHILKYEEVVKGGKYLVIAHGSADDVKKAQQILSATGALELNTHAETA